MPAKPFIATSSSGRMRFRWTNDMFKHEYQPSQKNVRVHDLITDYLNSDSFKKLSPNSKTAYIHILKIAERIIQANRQRLPEMWASRVDYNHVDYTQAVLEHQYKPATIKGLFTILSMCWELGLRNGKVLLNPWLRNKVSVKNERDVTWTKKEIYAVIDAANKLKFKPLARFIVIMYETGQRPQDLLYLTNKNVVIKGDNELWLDFIISKTGVHLEIPLSSKAVECLPTFMGDDRYLFSDEGRYVKYYEMYIMFNKAREHAGLPKELTMRDIRRTVAVELSEAGVTDQELRGVFGWKNNSVIHRYSRIRGSYAKSAFNKRRDAVSNS